MKRLLIFFILLFSPFSQGLCLTYEELLRDIQSLPNVQIEQFIPNKEDKVDYYQIKAIQVFVLPPTIEEIERAFAMWSESGVNTIILRCFHNEGDRYHSAIKSPLKEGVYFKTSSAPVISDVLSTVIPIAKRHNLRVFAWMTTRYADYGADNLERVIAYSFEKSSFLPTKGLNIFSPSVQNHILSLFRSLASYPIDGILLQDDLFFRYNEGFNRSTISLFKTETGLEATPELFFIKKGKKHLYTEAFWQWRSWKSKKLAEFVAKIRDEVKKVNPNIQLAVNLTYEAVSNPKGALAWLAHDFSLFKNAADYFSLMAYHRQIMDELSLDLKEVKKYIAAMVTQCLSELPSSPQRFLFKLQVKDWRTNVPIDDREIRDVFYSAKGIERLSLALVPYPPEVSANILTEIFRHTALSKLERPR